MASESVDKVNQTPAAPPTDVFEALHGVMHLFRARQYGASRKSAHGLTHLEGRVLGILARQPGTTLSDLVERSGRDKGQLARLIATLRQKRLLAAEPDTEDRRQVRLTLTDSGRALHQTLQRQRARLSQASVEGFTASEQATLIGLLGRMRRNLERD